MAHDEYDNLVQHPVMLYFGLLASLTQPYGNRRKGLEYLSFASCEDAKSLRYHFDQKIETHLLFIILLFVFNPAIDLMGFHGLSVIYNETYGDLFEQVWHAAFFIF